ncbi:HTH-type transcriptional regulator PrtR [Fundidesulfovibrio magnetotacticus]|uniref:HTH-type transcriptional regulator PrtR n=2 Tax=Fundidesulfovibrio magnetotacticus TaxID=2730080 RepID=A0A6V8LQH3_9BACT|nr:HTH-type transcriptional regulator PrtR [Fundidesulfovibrio magnetotacticus]
MIPKVKARLSAGGGSLETGDEVVGLYAFRTEFVKRKGNSREMVLMDVSGDSMEPEIKSGDTLLIDQSQRKIIAGCIYAVGMDEEVVVKVLEKAPGKLILRSYNTLFPAIEIDMRGDLSDGVRIIGRVIWWCREAR